ncbi:hypothetical protein A4A49_16862 [Nicotiana attenuata]|uniref:Uncharacterized protein n=1 Tax=Nicotiana attenuata TaxID=49451 RepID=A0A314L3Y0_NICAT|nr:hypothetical protein A4A49_16862 [Nicotiana attenuata]
MFRDSAAYIGGLAREFLILHLGSNWFDKFSPTNLPDSKVCHLKISLLSGFYSTHWDKRVLSFIQKIFQQKGARQRSCTVFQHTVSAE